ncbi:DTW domain-containing protein [Marinomonas sp. C2222]|uniref:tRNA-uridine aminocarboxypropyltransferase n=1 Tax=Marinomonas sargassi TaxID=2984494 RepID=A0ABT2YRX5_9GAMM|nr:DTW domain-containing protein [Marinomonas sargassi]MCV2402643.1 DTW domain-containing protein [Marinomonas sargassi]
MPKFKQHCVDTLREQCKLNSMRPFHARGSNLTRCRQCLMADFSCFCHLRKQQISPINFILIYHRDEIHKPTNSGRLIADLFPDNTQAFLWDRAGPPTDLLELLEREAGNCTILFPNTETAQQQNRNNRKTPPDTRNEQSKHTFIILDGTWKQASKMFHQSKWLSHIPHYEINEKAQRSFLVRHSEHQMQFATAEVTSMLLNALGHMESSEYLLEYYKEFNFRCLASRRRGNQPSN